MEETIKHIDISKIEDSPYQGRLLDADAGEEAAHGTIELVNSIKNNGLFQPVVVRPVGDKYQLIDGHRRVISFKLLGRQNIPAIIKKYAERDAQVFSVVANLQRKNLRPIELALSLQKILDAGIFSDKKEISIAIGKDATYVGDVINTLKMDSRIIEDLAKNNTIRDFRILRIIRKSAPAAENKSDKQWQFYSEIIDRGLSRKEAAQLCSTKTTTQRKLWKISTDKNLLRINFNVSKLSKEQINLFTGIVEKSVSEISDKLKSIVAEKATEILPDYIVSCTGGQLDFHPAKHCKADKNTGLCIESILERQHEYFTNGDDMERLMPMTLYDIAKKTNLDISSVSRAIKNRSVQTAHNTFLLKSLFSEAIPTKSGDKVSSIIVKKAVMEIIDKEDKQNPLTDEDIAGMLIERDYLISRRTVAKYREQLRILPTHSRKI